MTCRLRGNQQTRSFNPLTIRCATTSVAYT